MRRLLRFIARATVAIALSALLTVVMQNLIENGLKYVQDRAPQVIVQSETSSRGTHVQKPRRRSSDIPIRSGLSVPE